AGRRCHNINPLTNFAAGGTIYVTSSPAVGNPLGANVGLQIMGSNDPNYLRPGVGLLTLARSGSVVTAQLSGGVPCYYVNGATISVFDAQNTTAGPWLGDASFNGNFTLTAVNTINQTLTWSQTGANSTVTGGGIVLP